MKKIKLIFILCLFVLMANGQNFTYSGYVYNADGTGAINVPVKLYKRTTPTLTGFTSQTNYNGHSYYRSTGSMTWTDAKTACENMGGHLATVSNAAENNFLFNTWPSGWIGYYQDKVAGYTYSEPLGGYRWTETKVTTNQIADYDVSSYVSGTTLTDIKGGINATLYNSPTYTSTGGKYLSFNGVNQYAISGNLASGMGNTNHITLFAWIFPTGNGVIASELGTGSPSSGWHESVIEITGSNTLRVGFWSGTGIVQLNTAITLNAWHLVAVTYDGTTMKGYLNNVSFGSVNFQREAAHLYSGNGEFFAFGLTESTNMGSGAYGAYRLGDFQVFNRALTADELDRTYNFYAYRYKLNQFVNWNGGEPNNSGNEDYAQFVGGGKWNDLPNTSLPYVIEFDYINDFTPWLLFRTVYTDSNGRYVINESSNPATEWYLQFDAPTPVTTISLADLQSVSGLILRKFPINGVHYYQYDINGDGNIRISDAVYLNGKRYNLLLTPSNSFVSRYFTSAEYNTIKASTANLKVTYPGTSMIRVNSPVSNGVANYYLIAPGFRSVVTY
jgi:hypothetical protein